MKNKILPILLTFILISLLFINNNTFAVELVDQTSNGNNMYCPDLLFENVKALEEYSSYLAGDYKLLILQDGWLSGTDWFVYFLETDVNVYYDYARSNGYQIRFSAYNGVRYNCANDGIYELSNKTISFSYITCRVIEGTIQGYSSFNIYTDSSCTDFFFKTPLTETPETIPATVEIPKLETVEQIPETIITTLKLIIPVGLVILSMVLVIYLVRYEIYRFL